MCCRFRSKISVRWNRLEYSFGDRVDWFSPRDAKLNGLSNRYFGFRIFFESFENGNNDNNFLFFTTYITDIRTTFSACLGNSCQGISHANFGSRICAVVKHDSRGRLPPTAGRVLTPKVHCLSVKPFPIQPDIVLALWGD